MKDIEQLAISQALYNLVADQVSTKDPDNLRGRVSQKYVELYEETGAKSFDVKLGGEKVGTFSLTVSKPTDSVTKTDFFVTDEAKFRAWEDFNAAALDYATAHLQQIADWAFGMTGEIPEGCEVQQFEIAGMPGGEVTRTTLKVDTEKVVELVGNGLPEAARGLLEGGEND